MKHLSLAACLGLLSLTGCTSVATMQEWQKEVVDFVTIEGNGDLNILRDTENASGRRVLAVHGGKDAGKSTDVVGLVLGPRQVDNSLAYVFLVATINKGIPQDIRLVTLSRRERELVWRIGPQDSAAVNAYRRHHRRTDSNRLAPALAWPAKQDIFELNAADGTVTATELRSGAKWELTAAPKRPRRQK